MKRMPALVATLVLLAALVGCADDDADQEGRTRPSLPTTPTGATRATEPPEPTEPTAPGPGWPGAVREDQESLPVISRKTAKVDPPDADFGGIDIVGVSPSVRPAWGITLRIAPPLAKTLDPRRRVIEHGIVVDADGDRRADCRIGISTDAPGTGDLRVWVTDLDTGAVDEQVGPPYGYPIDFFHPSEGEDLGPDASVIRTVSLFFLGGNHRFCGGERKDPTLFYAYAALLDRGEEPQWDFAPDAAWAHVRRRP